MAKKNEQTPPDASAATAVQDPPKKVYSPGTVPSMAAQRFTLPPVEQLHYSQVFPDDVPQPLEAAPGVFVNSDGSQYVPREIKGGQFAAMLLIMKPKFGGTAARERQMGIPLATPENDYPVKDHEKVVRRIEVVFDFEKDMQAFLAGYRTDNGDPMKAAFRKVGMEQLYDSNATSTLAG